mmetsp:Transcript_42550/g.49261  ORF Transcript_42550/g.49261 Transcript_42550/m.49261 type:complete len:466 (-) Transcript_42550:105-1502(-)
MLSPSPSKRSPSLKRERTNYRSDFAYRTIRTYESPPKHSSNIVSSVYEAHGLCGGNHCTPQKHSSPQRSNSPRLRSELTNYRTEAHYRTVKDYETPKKSEARDQERTINYRSYNYESPRRASPLRDSELRSTNFRNYNYDRQQCTKRSPQLKAEPVHYREDTNYRTVRVYDHTLHLNDNAAEQSGKKDIYESEVKKPQEKGEKKDAGAVAKKLDFEQAGSSKKEENIPRVNAVDSRTSTIRKSQNQCLFKTHEEQFLVKTLNRVVVYDKQLENQKNLLAGCLDFTMQGAFKKLVGEAGTKEKFGENLRNLGVFFTQTELDGVFKRFDADGDGKISYHEFENVIYPVSLPYARMIRLRIDEQPLSKETCSLLLEFVNLIGEIEGAIEDLRTKISKRVSLDEAFKALDQRARGSVEIYEFKKMLESHGFCPETNDLAALKHRVDLNEDGRVTNDEFTVSMSPVKGGK